MNLRTDINVEQNDKWKVGYEVCFYRDWFKAQGQSAKKLGFSGKRTFDLCFFSNKAMVIIEAKHSKILRNKKLIH